SPDGRTLAVSDDTMSVRFYDTASLRLRRVVTNLGYEHPVVYVADGARLVANSWVPPKHRVPDVDVRDARTLRLVRRLPLDPPSLGFTVGSNTPLVTPDGRTALFVYELVGRHGSLGKTVIDRWDVATGRRQRFELPVTNEVGAMLLDHGRELALDGAD